MLKFVFRIAGPVSRIMHGVFVDFAMAVTLIESCLGIENCNPGPFFNPGISGLENANPGIPGLRQRANLAQS